MSMSIIELIQGGDPSYDPLTQALAKLKLDREDWKAANNRIYTDGYFGPVNQEEWEETTNWKTSFTVPSAREFVAKVLNEVEDYYEMDWCDGCETSTTCTGHRIWETKVEAEEIRAALVPYYKEIYGVGYPT